MKKFPNAAHNASLQLAICAALLGLSAILFASSFRGAANKPPPEPLPIRTAFHEPPATPTPAPPNPLLLTQSTSQTVVIGDAIAPCANHDPLGGRAHTDNSYWRAFDMEKLTD